MPALILILVLAGFYILWRVYIPGQDWRASVLAALTSWGFLVTLSTEILNILKAITWQSVLIFWLLVLAIQVILVFRRKENIPFKFSSEKPWISGTFREWCRMRGLTTENTAEPKPQDWLEWGMLAAIVGWLGITLFVALISPPNTNDALQYHMSRVMHWIVNRSVDFYITPIDRQLWMPPFGEYTILHFQLLAGNDRFANLIQWLSSFGSITGVSLIAGQLGMKRNGQLFAAMFAATLPMGVLQSTSAQTDYVAAFWGVALAYFVLKLCGEIAVGKNFNFSTDTLMLGLAFGLGALSKGTFYAIALPLLAFLLVVLLWKRRWKMMLALAMTGLACGLLINLGIWGRNISVYGTPLGPAAGAYGSSNFAPAAILSTAWRNAATQLAFRGSPVNKLLYKTTELFHQALEMDANDPRTTLGEFAVKFSYHEDYAGNNWQFLLFLVMLFFMPGKYFMQLRQAGHAVFLSRLKSKSYAYYLPLVFGFLVTISYLLISALFKWQPTNNRLLLPWFLLLPPLVAWGYENTRRFAQILIALVLAINSLPVLVSNPSRPLISLGKNESILTASRLETLFNNSPEVKNAYISVMVTARELGCKSYGLELDSSDPEYLIWAILSPSGQDLAHVEHFFGMEETTQFASPGYRPCAVICSICNITRSRGYELLYERGDINLFIDPEWAK